MYVRTNNDFLKNSHTAVLHKYLYCIFLVFDTDREKYHTFTNQIVKYIYLFFQLCDTFQTI